MPKVDNVGSIKVSEFIDKYYRIFWNNQNIDRNTFYPKEQLITVNRAIIWAAYKLGMRKYDIRKTVELAGETSKYHVAGNASIEDSVMGMGTDYRRQVPCRVFHGIGNFGTRSGGGAAAARYTSIQGTPLLSYIFKDLPFVPMIIDETGLEMPEWISMPFPMMLVNGCSQVGLGKAAYLCERNINDIVDWLEQNMMNRKDDDVDYSNCTAIPKPISSTECKVWTNPKNGYIVYEAVINREGKYDVITALPPKVTEYNLIATLKKKLPKNVADRIVDASGEGEPIKIMVPKGYITPDNLAKFHLQNARKEAPFIWSADLGTMRMSSFEEIAHMWFKARKEIVTKRLESMKSGLENQIHRIDLIKEFVDNKMSTWKTARIEEYFGKEDSDIVLECRQRVFLPENIGKNEILRENLTKDIKKIDANIKNIGKFIIKEAREIITKQEDFYKDLR